MSCFVELYYENSDPEEGLFLKQKFLANFFLIYENLFLGYIWKDSATVARRYPIREIF